MNDTLQFVVQYGYALLFGWVMIEQGGLPIPATPLLLAAGALAGVVLERHLAEVCNNHQIPVTKKAPTIFDLNEALKAANVTDVPEWRYIQHLADIRNLCDHNRKAEPTPAQVEDLIAGVAKVIKTLF